LHHGFSLAMWGKKHRATLLLVKPKNPVTMRSSGSTRRPPATQ
jgi:hypothetical protein